MLHSQFVESQRPPVSHRFGRASAVFVAASLVASLLSVVPAQSVLADPAGKALQLNGSTQYVTFGTALGLDSATFTLELWFKWNGGGTTANTGSGGVTAIPLLTKGLHQDEGSNVDANYFLGIAGGKLAADFEDMNTGLNHPITGVTTITQNVWHHAAATYGAPTWKLYLDGALDSSFTILSCSPANVCVPRSDSIQHAGLGTALNSTGVTEGRFAGVVDEARIWNVVRTQAEIQGAMRQELTSGTGLLGRWGLYENTGTVANNSVGTGPNGTIVGSPTWVNGFPDNTIPVVPTGLTATSGIGQVALSWNANAESDLAGYNVYRGIISPVTKGTPLNGGTPVASPAYTDTSGTPGTPYYYAVTAVDTSANESGLSGEATGTSQTPPPGPYGLDLGSGTAYVTFGDPAKLDLLHFTIETWFKRTGTGTPNTTGGGGITILPLVTHGAPEAENSNVDANWILGIRTDGITPNVIAADFEANPGGQNYPISGTTAVANNVWHHAAATYDGTTWKLYLDGNLEATSSPGVAPRSDTIQRAALGTMLPSVGAVDPTPKGHFQGVIDEARVWNVARTQSQIKADINNEVTSGSGLAARWGLNEGYGTAVADSIASPANGTVTNSGFSWVAGAPFNIDVTPPAAPTGFSATDGQGHVDLAWTANGEADLAGYNLYRSTTTPVPTTGTPLNGSTLIAKAATAYADTTGTVGTTYHYALVAVDTTGNASPSAEAEGTPQPDMTPPAAPHNVAAAPGNGLVTVTWSGNTEPDLAGYNVYRGTSPGVPIGTPLNGATPLAKPFHTQHGLTNGTPRYYVVTAVDTSTNESVASSEVSATPSASSGCALNFDGTSQYVTMGPATDLGAAAFTLETWFYWTGGGVTANTGSGGVDAIPLVTKGLHEAEGSNVDANYFLGIAGGKLAADFEDMATGLNRPVTGVATISPYAWHHAAATYDGQVWKLYLDGTLDKTLDLGAPVAPRSDSIQHAGLATAMNSTGVREGSFAGFLDEARIWSVARSQVDIQATMTQELTSFSGLLGRFGLNECSGTAVANSVAGNSNGTAGPTLSPPEWVAGKALAPAKTAQTITFGPLTGLRLDETPPALSASADSGLTVTFSSTTLPVCTVAGTTVTLKTIGTCTVRADQAGDATYAPAPPVTRSFTVGMGNQAITFGALADRAPSDPPFTIGATASSGLPVSFASTTLPVCTVAGTTVTLHTTGTCSITASQAGDPNWNAAADVPQSFQVSGTATEPVSYPAVFRDGAWYLRDSNTSAPGTVTSFAYGDPTDTPIFGDWNADGVATPGVVRVTGGSLTWYLRNTNSAGAPDLVFSWGAAADKPLVGDWDGNGTDTPGLLRGGNHWILSNSANGSSGIVDFFWGSGAATEKPIVGDWDGNGTDTPGMVRAGNWWLLKNTNTGGLGTDVDFFWGTTSETNWVVGDWNGDGSDNPGILRGNWWLLKDSNTGGGATDRDFFFGLNTDTFRVWAK